jgi:outer membrane protein OmpA-like peptidoglycan-associated protein
MITRLVGISTICVCATVHAQAGLPVPNVAYVDGQHGKVTGLIISRDGNDLLVRDETTGRLSMVTITPTTDIGSPSGFLNVERKEQPPTTLISGLIIVVKGTGGARHNLVADRITFRTSALRVATQIAAGEVVLKARERQTAALAAANRDSIAKAKLRARDSVDAVNARVSNIDSYDLRVRGTVYFETGSAALSNEARMILDDLFEKSRGLDGYLIEVAGFMDDEGAAAETQMLSARRAQAVIEYLNTAHAVPLRRFAAPIGFTAPRVTDPARNRRAEVRVLVSRGLRGPPER